MVTPHPPLSSSSLICPSANTRVCSVSTDGASEAPFHAVYVIGKAWQFCQLDLLDFTVVVCFFGMVKVVKPIVGWLAGMYYVGGV